MILTKTRKALGVCSVITVMGLMYAQFGGELRLSPVGAEIIGNAEGCRRDPYQCPADVLTVGIGSTEYGGKKINPKHRYTDLEIAERWKNDIVIAERCVNKYGNGEMLPQSVFDSAVSITFNVGCGAVSKSTMFKYLRAKQYEKACGEFPRWVYASGKKLAGLVVRREKEKALCLADLKLP
ncbi:lysozyme [Haemophilus influenzae]|uniref:Lysozyme n=2 Tax=Haemophilus influenzae TaxID=727 RepID=A0A2S9S147_HAEIF|nr:MULTISPECIES: lysozyme [Haemophilus]EDJ90194.1 putative endolysin [Haemophilus influenzae R3021]AIT67280.1 glycoside hydrolase [Haemophilus influenzae]AXP45664.1 lysozyme [Haemophilus influenzae]AXP62806.1 lysozyme [Haemophilus influenzae]AXP64514.1 lysozyme [Haemophilus influenzae]